MLPSKIPVRSRPVRSFDLITPQGRTYRFPPQETKLRAGKAPSGWKSTCSQSRSKRACSAWGDAAPTLKTM